MKKYNKFSSIEGKKLIPYGFYRDRDNDNFQKFLTQDNVKDYKQNLVGSVLNIEKSDNNKIDYMSLIKIPINTLMSVEKQLLEDLSKVDNRSKEKRIKSTIKQPDLTNINNIDELMGVFNEYAIQFNRILSEFYLNENVGDAYYEKDDNIGVNRNVLVQNMKTHINDYQKGERTEQQLFIDILIYVSRTGGFKNEQVKSFSNKFAGRLNMIKTLGAVIEGKDGSLSLKDDGKGDSIQKNLQQTLDEVLDEVLVEEFKKAGIKILSKNYTVKGENKIKFYIDPDKVNQIKDEIENLLKSEDTFFKYVINIFKVSIKDVFSKNFKAKTNKKDKTYYEVVQDVVDIDTLWADYYNKAQLSLSKITFISSTLKEKNGSYVAATFKGDYGEFLSTYLNAAQKITVTGMGAEASNAEVMGNVQSGIDEVITIGKNRYGIQDKEYSLSQGAIKTNLYNLGNLTETLDMAKAIELLSKQCVEVLVTLIQLYDGEDELINKILSQADIGQIRAVAYEGLGNAAFSDIKAKNIIYSPIYRISGFFSPASTILVKRFYEIIKEKPIFQFDRNTQTKYLITRGFYKKESINDNLVSEILFNNVDKKIHTLDESEINNTLKALTITAVESIRELTR